MDHSAARRFVSFGTIGVASYWALGRVPPRLPTI